MVSFRNIPIRSLIYLQKRSNYWVFLKCHPLIVTTETPKEFCVFKKKTIIYFDLIFSTLLQYLPISLFTAFLAFCYLKNSFKGVFWFSIFNTQFSSPIWSFPAPSQVQSIIEPKPFLSADLQERICQIFRFFIFACVFGATRTRQEACFGLARGPLRAFW